jgi:hypothetical protein
MSSLLTRISDRHPGRRYIVDLDSTSSMLYAISHYLRGQDYSSVGVTFPGSDYVARLINKLPTCLLRTLYSWSGWMEGTPINRLHMLCMNSIDDWMACRYPPGRYPAALIGASNGAAVHLAAALGAPWVPQTFLLPVRRHLPVDDLRADLEWGREPAQALLNRHSDIRIHQMHDPIQDRQMLRHIGYFRIKHLTLGPVWRAFLKMTLAPGATLLVLDCRYRWPVSELSPGHVFQSGGFGDVRFDEMAGGSDRIRNFLRRERSSDEQWDVPEATALVPEAEWGFAPEMAVDIERFAGENGYRVLYIGFTDPESLSPLIADLYEWWYARRDSVPQRRRLLAECFALLEPWWTINTRSIPYWLVFNTQISAFKLERYLETRRAFDELFLLLMSNGIVGVGQVSTRVWREILSRAGQRGEFVGVDEKKFPADIGSFLMYHNRLEKMNCRRYGPLSPMTVEEVELFFRQNVSACEVTLTDEAVTVLSDKPGGCPSVESYRAANNQEVLNEED